MQPTPKPNNTQPIHEQVIDDIKRRAEVGKQNYGTYLQVGNGRDPLLDAYEEAQDKALYLKQAILERDDLVMELEAAREAVSEESNRWVSVIRGIDPEALCDFHDEHGSQEYLKAWLDARDRRMRLLGAAEELERLVDSVGSGLVMGDGEFFDGVEAERRQWQEDLRERAAKLRQEAEGK